MTRVNDYGQTIGDPVPGWTPRPVPAPVVLAGRTVRLEPVSLAHAPHLYAALCRPADEPLWTYRTQDRPRDLDGLATLLAAAAADPLTVTFAIVPREAGVPQGLTTLMRVDPAQGSLEVGSILFSRDLQRTTAATEALVLVARHVLGALGYRRLEWKCDSANEPSRRAAARLGLTFEGRFRQAMVYKERNRDTDWFALTDPEWPRVSAAYDAWLDPGNFGPDGRQRQSLSTLTAREPTHPHR